MSLSEVLCRYTAGTLNISPRAGHMNFDISCDLTTIGVRGLLLMTPPPLGRGQRATEKKKEKDREENTECVSGRASRRQFIMSAFTETFSFTL